MNANYDCCLFLSFVCIYTFQVFLQGGMTVQLCHKVLEAYLVADGLFDYELAEDGEFAQALNMVLSLIFFHEICN